MRARPWVLMMPKFGETKKTTLHLAYHLVANGLNVLRFDPTNHVGESEGRMLDFTMPGAVTDAIAGLDYLEASFGVNQVTTVANSLSARCMLRVAAKDSRIQKLICVAGVVNLIATIQEINKEDLLGLYQQGHHWGVTDFLGFDINGDVFLRTLIESKLGDLAGSIEDAARLNMPFVFFYAERDVWVDKLEVEQVVAVNPRGQLVPVAAAMHEVRENPQAARQLFEQVVWTCLHDEPYPGKARPICAALTRNLSWRRTAGNGTACAVPSRRWKASPSFGQDIFRNIAFWRKPRTTGPIWTWWAGFAGPCPRGARAGRRMWQRFVWALGAARSLATTDLGSSRRTACLRWP